MFGAHQFLCYTHVVQLFVELLKKKQKWLPTTPTSAASMFFFVVRFNLKETEMVTNKTNFSRRFLMLFQLPKLTMHSIKIITFFFFFAKTKYKSHHGYPVQCRAATFWS